jgi:hypothetical protein
MVSEEYSRELEHLYFCHGQVERIFGGPQPDPADMEKAKKLLKVRIVNVPCFLNRDHSRSL